jgi:hypothetical protein
MNRMNASIGDQFVKRLLSNVKNFDGLLSGEHLDLTPAHRTAGAQDPSRQLNRSLAGGSNLQFYLSFYRDCSFARL